MNAKILTAVFLINRSWPIAQVENGTASRVVLEAIKGLSSEEFREVLNTYKKGE